MCGGEVAIRCGDFDLRKCDAVLVRSMPPGSLEQVVFRMDALARLEAAGVVVIAVTASLGESPSFRTARAVTKGIDPVGDEPGF